MTKHERECIRLCKSAGLQVLQIRYGGKHLKIACAQGVIVCPSTPSDVRWHRNLLSIARKVARENHG